MKCPLCNSSLNEPDIHGLIQYNCVCNGYGGGSYNTFTHYYSGNYDIWMDIEKGLLEFHYNKMLETWRIWTRIEATDDKGSYLSGYTCLSTGADAISPIQAVSLLQRYKKLMVFS